MRAFLLTLFLFRANAQVPANCATITDLSNPTLASVCPAGATYSGALIADASTTKCASAPCVADDAPKCCGYSAAYYAEYAARAASHAASRADLCGTATDANEAAHYANEAAQAAATAAGFAQAAATAAKADAAQAADADKAAASAAKARYANIAANYFITKNNAFTIGSLVTLALEDLEESAKREVLKTVYNGVAC